MAPVLDAAPATDVRLLAFSLGGKILVGGSWVTGDDEDSLVFWNAEGDLLSAHRAVPEGVSGVAFSLRGGRVVLAGADGAIRFWDTAGKEIRKLGKKSPDKLFASVCLYRADPAVEHRHPCHAPRTGPARQGPCQRLRRGLIWRDLGRL